MLCSIQDIQAITLKSSAKRQNYGRFLYEVQQKNQHFYLKYQQNKPEFQHHIHFFQKEFDFYQQFPTQCLPYQYLDTSLLQQFPFMTFESDAQALFIVKGQLLFNMTLQPIEVLWRVAQCVANFHQCGYLHGDLKPEHFIYYQQGDYLIDFEYIEPIGQVNTKTHATPRYMAPELFQGNPKTIASEIYALGIIFYQYLSQQRLVAPNYHAWATLHCQQLNIEHYLSNSEFLPLLKLMLAKQQTQRISTMDDVLEQLYSLKTRYFDE